MNTDNAKTREQMAYELATVSGNAIQEVIKIVDKYGMNRTEMVHSFVHTTFIGTITGNFDC